MKRVFAVICLAAMFFCGVSFTRAEKNTYPAGKYEVGKSLEEGEYILFSAADQTGSFVVSSDADGLDVITEGSFESNTILTVLDGDFLELTGCTAVSAGDYYSVSRIEPGEIGGMLKVGVDIKPGVYGLVAVDGKAAVCRIYEDSRHGQPLEENAFQDWYEVKVTAGQYLELTNCSVAVMIIGLDSDDEADFQPETPPPTRTPKPAPKPTPEPEEGPGPQPDEKDAPAVQEQTRKVRIDKSRTPAVRSIASTKGEKIGEAKAGVEYELLEDADRWYKIRLEDGQEGWITSAMAEIIE